MKQWTNELLNVCWEDGHPVAILHQNGTKEIYILKVANKQDIQELLEIDVVKE